jgi:8-oxo-dGTP pyrophosphatase MutT (NUDIX family)
MSESSALETKQPETERYRLERYENTNEPLFIDTTPEGAYKEGKETIERNAIMAIVKDPSINKYLGLKWKKIDWKTLITGGVEEGQTPEEAAREEIRQETGYMNLRLVKRLTNVHSKFFHGPKGVNRLAHFAVLYFELENNEREELSGEEREIHDVVWLDAGEMDAFGLLPAHTFSWNELQKA